MIYKLPSDVVRYSEIGVAVQRLDKARTYRVLLSHAQAQYFRRHLLTMCGLRRRASNAERFEGLKFHLLQLTIFFRFPRLFELSLLYEIDDATLDRVQFDEVADGTLVTFIPKRDGDRRR